MQVTFTSEQEAHLAEVALHSGTDPEQLVRNAALRVLEEDLQIRNGVERGLAAAAGGEFVEDADVWNKVTAILNS